MSGIVPVDWRIVLCDRVGTAIAWLDWVATTRQFKFLLNRPAVLSFNVPSDAALVNALHSDGYPFLSCGDRTIRAWRREAGAWVLRYTGIVWQLGDSSDEDVSHTTVTCFDPFKYLMKRIVVGDAGFIESSLAANPLTFPSADLGHTIYTILDNNASHHGPVYMDYSSGPWTVGTTLQPPSYTLSYVDAAITDLCDTGSVDIIVDPVYSTSPLVGTAGHQYAHLADFSAVARRGEDKPDVLFGYDIGNFGAQAWQRDMDMEPAANSIFNFSGETPPLMSHAIDDDSWTRFGLMQSAEVLSEIDGQGVLDDLTAWELRMRRNPQDLVTFTPRPELQPECFADYFLGDTVRVACSNSVREAISGSQRVYGITLDVNDDGYEVVSELIVSASQE